MIDLFGNPITNLDFELNRKTLIRKVLGPLNYRECEEDWRRCGTCAKHVVRRGRYHKCKLLGTSFSAATDIRVYHVCDAWERPEEGVQLELEP